ncbi:MAG: phage tail protein I [Oscillospiraceae bacterium]|jgi:phage tail P2-like protein|nr:phage tail protein I [Oscillospiraceae bacterium]
MTEHGITVKNLLRTLPEVLRDDEKMLALGRVIAEELTVRASEIDRLKIYSRIDELPEDLLDILAYDFKVDWYGYNYDLETKRALIKDSFNVHRHLGTRGAVEKALSNVYVDAKIEEWHEYGGDPYYFRVLLDVTNQRAAITHSDAARSLNIYKSLRSHLQYNAIIYYSRIYIGIRMVYGYVIYATRVCGTFPIRATQGGVESGGIGISAGGNGVSYSVRFCGAVPGSI